MAPMAVEAMPVAGPAKHLPPGDWPPQGRWTYERFLALPDDSNRYEIIEGVLYVSPPPSPQHQDRLFALCRRLADFIDRQASGKLFLSPIALLIPGASPVQPDAFFLRAGNPAIIDWQRHLEGIPGSAACRRVREPTLAVQSSTYTATIRRPQAIASP